MRQKYKFGIKIKTSLIITGIAIIFLSIVFFRGTSFILSGFLSEQENNMRIISKLIANAYIVNLTDASSNEKDNLENYIRTAMLLNKNIAAIIIKDENDSIYSANISKDYFEYSKNSDMNKIAQKIINLPLTNIMKKISLSIKKKDTPSGSVVVFFSTNDILDNIDKLKRTFFKFAVFSLLLLGAAGYISAGKITKPILEISKNMEEVEKGNFDVKIPEPKTEDEMKFLIKTFNKMTEGLKEREKIKQTFSRYVSRQVFDKIMKDKYKVSLGGEKRTATVLFSDIRGFTTIGEQLKAEQVVFMLNKYFDRMLEIIFKYDGMLDKFMGDAIMAVYNAPIEIENPELKAIQTGMEMLEALKEINKDFEKHGLPEIDIGIGINTGEVVAGNIGSKEKIEYTVIGDAVNLAQRIESATKELRSRLLINSSTYEKVKNFVEAAENPLIAVKGKKNMIKLYTVKKIL